MSPSGASSRSTITGAWPLGPSIRRKSGRHGVSVTIPQADNA
jgi:hypothetical protein